MAKLSVQALQLNKKSERAIRHAFRILRPGLRRIGRKAAEAVANELNAVEKAKDDKKKKTTDRVMKSLESEYKRLALRIEIPLATAAVGGAEEAAAQLPGSMIDEFLPASNETARAWAHDRAAELVGMKWIDGELVENPNPKWAITETVRDDLQGIIEKAFEAETDMVDLQDEIEESGAFGEARAEMIARTEISRAQIQGNWAIWSETGMVVSYDWLLSEDEDVCDICEEIADNGPYQFGKGPIPIDDSHPNCRCIVVSNVIEEPKAAAQISNLEKSTGEETAHNREESKVEVINKSTNSGDLRLALPITKIDQEKRMVYVTATSEMLDSVKDITDYDAISKAFDSWPANIREMHQPKAIGSAIEIMKDDAAKKIDLGIYVSKGAQDTWEKVLDKTLKGASIGVPYGSYRREPVTVNVTKADGSTEAVRANRLFVENLAEVSLVDNPANPDCQIWMVKSVDGVLQATETMNDPQDPPEAPPAPEPEDVEKKSGIKAVVGRLKGETKTTVQTVIFPKEGWSVADAKKWLTDHDLKAPEVDETENSLRFRQRDPGEFKKGSFRTIAFGKTIDLSSESLEKCVVEVPFPDQWKPETAEDLRKAIMYLARPRNRSAYGAEDLTKMDARIQSFKKEFRIGEYAEKMEEIGLYKCGDSRPADWVSLNTYENTNGMVPTYEYRPRTFGEVWEDTESVDVFVLMGQQLGRVVSNIMGMRSLSGERQAELIQQSFDEFLEEIDEELMEADERAAAKEPEAKTSFPSLLKSTAKKKEMQEMHDMTVKYGAECSVAEKSVEVVHIAPSILEDMIQKSVGRAMCGIGKTQQPSGVSEEKAIEITKAEVSGAVSGIEAKLEEKADKSEIAKVSETVSTTQGDLEKVKGDLDNLKKTPAIVPVVRTQALEKFLVGSGVDSIGGGGDDLSVQIESLTKMQAEESDPVMREKLGMRIGTLKIKRTLRGE